MHQLREGEDLILGGINIPYFKGAFGHSDADVLIHAICDAILGASNMRDIGFHFPDNSDDYKEIDSKILLTNVRDIVFNKGYELCNIDSTICLETPKISDYTSEMSETIANCMQVEKDLISIK